ncbi:MAG: hypothetical protein K2J99_16995 [Lachnospiraceae bacterium]|nr:hypothetical protein [Lachnospiraceae bacterium]
MYENMISALRQKGIEFAIGLSDEEFYWIEQEYAIVFPEELKKIYKVTLPVSKGFYNWRDRSKENVANIKRVMQVPIQGIVDNMDEIDWNEEWGEEPSSLEKRKIKIEDMMLKAPKLIPIYLHRYMPAFKCERPPIFSVCGTDIIYFAKNIIDYFLIEFGLKENEVFMNNEVSYIPFWSDLL